MFVVTVEHEETRHLRFAWPRNGGLTSARLSVQRPPRRRAANASRVCIAE